MKIKTKTKPIIPAVRLLVNDSEPKTASTFLSWIRFNLAGKAPDLN